MTLDQAIIVLRQMREEHVTAVHEAPIRTASGKAKRDILNNRISAMDAIFVALTAKGFKF